FTRPRVTADANLRIQPVCCSPGVGGEHDDTHRVLAGGVIRGGDRFFYVARAGADDESEHATERDGPAFFSDVDVGARNLAHRRFGQFVDHGRLQVLPSRTRSSSAEAGPHEPSRYGSVHPPAAQYSSMVSRIFQLSSTSSWRGNRGVSPMSMSRISLSYASGLSSVKACP